MSDTKMEKASDDPDGWSAIRIQSGSSIQHVVASSLDHLVHPGSGPLILHTLPPPSTAGPAITSENDIAKSQKTIYAATGKLISIVEIVKRSFEEHQKQKRSLDAQDKSTGKGKKRARPDDEEVHIVARDARADSDQPLLRLYQYNVLDYRERHEPSKPDQPVAKENGPASAANGDTATGNQVPTDNPPPEAVQALDKAIKERVLQDRKRPRKKHTPTLKIVLFSTRLPSYEKAMKECGTEYTLQLPPKPKQNRNRTRKPHGPPEQLQADSAMATEASNHADQPHHDPKIAADEAKNDAAGLVQAQMEVETAQPELSSNESTDRTEPSSMQP